MFKYLLLLTLLFVQYVSFSQDTTYIEPLHTPEKAEAVDLYIKGSNKYYKRDFKGAIEDLTKAVELNPAHSGAFEIRASCKSLLGDRIGAIRDYSKAIEIVPYEYGNYQRRAELKYELEDYRGALLDINKSIELNATPGGHTERGRIKYKLKDYAGSLRDLNLAIQKYPDSDDAHYYRGLVKWHLGDKENACLDWSKAGEYGIDHAYELIKDFCN